MKPASNSERSWRKNAKNSHPAQNPVASPQQDPRSGAPFSPHRYFSPCLFSLHFFPPSACSISFTCVASRLSPPSTHLPSLPPSSLPPPPSLFSFVLFLSLSLPHRWRTFDTFWQCDTDFIFVVISVSLSSLALLIILFVGRGGVWGQNLKQE